MISGYNVGTNVKWNEGNSLVTGTIIDVFRQTTQTTIDGNITQIMVNDKSPSYLILRNNGKYIVLPHTNVMRESLNSHT